MLTENTLLQNRYRILCTLSDKGGMGLVYQATDTRLGNTVIIKQTRQLQLSADLRETVRNQFFSEARLLANLRHPALPRVSDYFAEGASQFLVMEFVPGKDLQELLDERLQNTGVAFSIEEALGWADRLLDVLEYLHSHEPPVIHRDIKPANLKLTPRGEIMLLDFGLAKGQAIGMSQAASSLFGYTREYAPLEQIQGDRTDARTDLFSLAATLHHLLTGALPPDALTRTIRVSRRQPDPLQRVNEIVSHIPGQIAEALYAALSQNPDERPASAQAMRQALRVSPSTPTPPRPIAPPAVINELPTMIRTPKASPFPPLLTGEFTTVTLNARGDENERRKGQAKYFIEDLGHGVTLEMVEVPAGDFLMGSTDAETQAALAEARRYNKDARLEWFTAETPRRRVTLPPFFMGRYEVTQAQWRAVTGGDPSNFKGDKLPVESVSWNDAQEFCSRLSKKTSKTYRLPSEAEWEYAARAGTTTPFAFGETVTPQYVNYDGNYPYASAPKGENRQQTVPVGSLGMANAFGLSDLHGNVWEWCEDVWHPDYNGAPTDGRAWASAGDQNLRVLRGGSWLLDGRLCRSANRYSYAPGARDFDIGFRVVVSARTQ